MVTPGTPRRFFKQVALMIAVGVVVNKAQLVAQVGVRRPQIQVQRMALLNQSAPALQVEANDSQDAGWDDAEPVDPPNAEQRGRRVMLTISVDHWVYGREGTHGRDLLQTFLRQKLAAVKREYEQLSDQHLEKLGLAGRGDIKRFEDQVEILKAKYPQNTIDQEHLHLLLAEVQTLRQRLQSDHFFGNQSLLAKTLRSIVTKEQLTPKYTPTNGQLPIKGAAREPDPLDVLPAMIVLPNQRAVIAGARINMVRIPQRGDAAGPVDPARQNEAPAPVRDEQYYVKLIEVISANFEPEVPLRHEQRELLIALLRKASQRAPQVPLHDSNLTLLRLSDLPEEDFRAILDKRQWNGLSSKFDAVRKQFERTE